MKEKIVIIGAGSAVFTKKTVANFLKQSWEGEMCLVDIDPKALAVAEGLVKRMLAVKKSNLKLSAYTDRRQALPGATVVICTVGVGGRRAWEQDVFVPRKYGIHQPIGDTVGPGGTSRALRMIPAMVAIAEDVVELAPQALFFNYSNPMSAVCRAVRKATGAPVVGLCHGVTGTATRIARTLEVDIDRMKYTAVGINHLAWFTEVRVDGEDMMPKLIDLTRETLSRFTEKDEAFRKTRQAFLLQMMDLFHAHPSVGDRHICEFFGQMFFGEGQYYGKTMGVDVHGFERIVRIGDKRFAEMKEVAESSDPLPDDFFDGEDEEEEQLVEILCSIRADAGRIYPANLPNTGQIPNLPLEAVVECPAIADAGGMRAIAQKPLSAGICGTLASRFQWVETVVEAALEGSRRKFIQALLIDRSLDSIETAGKLADDLLRAQAKYLPQFEIPEKK